MSVSVITDEYGAVMYCNTSMWAFGPVFNSEEDVWQFKSWLNRDPRDYSESELESKYAEWIRCRGLEFDTEKEREAFIEWLSKDISQYSIGPLENIYGEWKRTVWDVKR